MRPAYHRSKVEMTIDESKSGSDIPGDAAAWVDGSIVLHDEASCNAAE